MYETIKFKHKIVEVLSIQESLKSIKRAAILKRYTFFAGNHSLTYSINGAIFIRKIPLGKWFSEGGFIGTPLGTNGWEVHLVG